MKIAVVSLLSRLGGTTGDCVQANKTAAALSSVGVSVIRCYVDPDGGSLYGSNRECLGAWADVLGDCDIVHAMVPYKYVKRFPRLKAKLACYTVFWKSLNCVRVCVRNQRGIKFSDIKDIVRILLSWIGIRSYGFFSGYDLLLPNSEDEIRQVKRFCLIKENASIVAVVNAVDDLPENITELRRPDCVPAEDYIVVPAYFAARKNQQSLIMAMRNSSFKIVFMGDGPMLERCKGSATGNMIFLGHVEHGTDLFWSVLKFARVVCLPSNCETPGIAGLEAAAVGARPVVPYEGGTAQYYGWTAEYLDPLSVESIRGAINKAWQRGRLSHDEIKRFRSSTWKSCALDLIKCYRSILKPNLQRES